MAVEAGDVLRVTAKFLVNDIDDMMNVFHAKHMGDDPVPDASAATDLSDRLDGAWGQLNSHISVNVDYVSIEVFNVTQDRPISEDSWFTQTAGGQSTDAQLPAQIASLVTFPTATARSLGKKFLGGFTEVDNENFGVVSSGLLSDMADFVTDLLGSMTIDGELFEWGNYRPLTLLFSPWVSGLIETFWATQRRRRSGVGS